MSSLPSCDGSGLLAPGIGLDGTFKEWGLPSCESFGATWISPVAISGCGLSSDHQKVAPTMKPAVRHAYEPSPVRCWNSKSSRGLELLSPLSSLERRRRVSEKPDTRELRPLLGASDERHR